MPNSKPPSHPVKPDWNPPPFPNRETLTTTPEGALNEFIAYYRAYHVQLAEWKLSKELCLHPSCSQPHIHDRPYCPDITHSDTACRALYHVHKARYWYNRRAKPKFPRI